MKVLAIESSCDDTSIAVINDHKNIDFLETINHRKFHQKHGGVIPEMAARQHLDILDLFKSKIHKINFSSINAIASTYGPGLIGGLIVGSSFAKGLAISQNKKLVPINHLQAHLLSPRLTNDIKFPYLCLLVSGGNTALVVVKNPSKFITLGSTIDDSAGECFDKVAKALDLGYPGGPAIERLAINGDPSSFLLPKPLTKVKNCDFSFSGLKTAAIEVIKKNKIDKKFLNDFTASFQFTVGEIFKKKIFNALDELKKENIIIKDFSICGGVAANKYLNSLLKNFIEERDINYHQVPLSLCTDNAAMIGWNAIEILQTRKMRLNNYNIRPTPNILIHENF
jgi:N6-L-threonylcarbamoyladenine synthase